MNTPPLHPGIFLQQRFLAPLTLSPHELASKAGLSLAYLTALIEGQESITAETAQRLARCLGTTPRLWMDRQADWELSQHPLADNAVVPLSTDGFLVGPEGATPLPPARAAAPQTHSVRVSKEDRARIFAQAALLPALPPQEHSSVVYEGGQHAWVSQNR